MSERPQSARPAKGGRGLGRSPNPIVWSVARRRRPAQSDGQTWVNTSAPRHQAGALYASGRGASGGFGFGSPNTISVWRDGSWSTRGTTSSFEPVWDLLVRGEEVIIGGAFYNVTSEDGEGSVEAGFLARWDGAAWHAFPAGPNATVRAIVEHGGDLCVGDSFDRVGEPEVRQHRLPR